MHHVTKEMWDAFPPDRKGDFWAAYLYLRYTEHFFNKSLQQSGFQPKDLPSLDPGMEDMLEAVNLHIAENCMSPETSLYHGKILHHKDALKLVTQKEDVNISPPERVIPFKIARDVVLHNPNSIVVGSCPCRGASANPCLPPGQQDVCLFLGDPWASFMDQHNDKFHRISQEEAVKVLESCHEKGFVHIAYFEHAVGNRMDAICNCCSCCCLGIRMWNLMAGTLPLLAPSGYVCEVSNECNGCGVCVDGTCHFRAISQQQEGQMVMIDLQKCMGCGVCVAVCPQTALILRREASKGDPLDLDALLDRT